MSITYIGVIRNPIRRNTSVSTLENPIYVLHFRFAARIFTSIYIRHLGLCFFFFDSSKKHGELTGALAWNRAHFFSFFFNTLPIHTSNNCPHENFRHQKKAPVLVGIARREAKGRVVSLLFVSLRVSSASFFRFVSRGRRTEKIGK